MATHTYSTYEAKAKFSEALQKARDGHRVVITYRGKEVAELRSIEPEEGSWIEQRIRYLEQRGELGPPVVNQFSRAKPLGKRPGGLARFLESRD